MHKIIIISAWTREKLPTEQYLMRCPLLRSRYTNSSQI